MVVKSKKWKKMKAIEVPHILRHEFSKTPTLQFSVYNVFNSYLINLKTTHLQKYYVPNEVLCIQII